MDELRKRLVECVWSHEQVEPMVAEGPKNLVDAMLAEIEAAGKVIVDRDRFERVQMEAISAVGMRGGVAKWAQPGDLEPLP